MLLNLSEHLWEHDAPGEVLLSWCPDVAVTDGRVTVPPLSAVLLG